MQFHPCVFPAFPEKQVVGFGENDHARKRNGILDGWRGEEIGAGGNADSNCPAALFGLEHLPVSQQNPAPGSEIILYQTEDGHTRLEVKLVNETVWLTQAQARRRKQVFIRDWRAKHGEFLKFHERGVLKDAGRVTREDADRHTERQYSLFEERRRKELEATAEAEFIVGSGLFEGEVKKIVSSKTRKRRKKQS